MNILVIGGGVFGMAAAVELRGRHHDVTVVDPGPIPHPLAESTDISKVVRSDYGGDVYYTELGERSIEGWRRWNYTFPSPLFHETGVMFLSRSQMVPGGFEYESFKLLSQRGHRVQRVNRRALDVFRAYRPGVFVDGYVHDEGGWVEAGSVVAMLGRMAHARGVTIRERCTIDRLEPGAALAGSERIAADATVVCAGSWTQTLVPELAGSLRAIGQPVFHFRPADPVPFDGSEFPVFGADIARTGYYGFPYANGVVKIANHGTGIAVTGDRTALAVTPQQLADVKQFAAEAFPGLADAPIVTTRVCVYGDSLDGHFWIAPHPERPDLIVAAGGSGHAFKFAPVLGELIANAVEGIVVPRFRWRPELVAQSRGDAARSDYQ